MEMAKTMTFRNLMCALMAFAMLGAITVSGQDFSWRRVELDGSRTGCTSPSEDNVSEALGTLEHGRYHAPNGRIYRRNSAAADVAEIVLAAQPAMRRVKTVIGYSSEEMAVNYPESALSNWFVDILIDKVEKVSGKNVHVGIANFGGIRIDMPEGDIILDDMLSMFPFRNHLVYIEHTGRQIRTILESMAAGRFQVLGGVRVVADGGRLVSATIDGEPIDDEKVYGLATISFLLSGGDGLSLEENALSVTHFSDVQIIDAVLEHVYSETAAGRPVSYQTDGRVVICDK